jgi:uncharacterized membrane protein
MRIRTSYRRWPARALGVGVLSVMAFGAPGCGDGPTTTETPPQPEVTVSATEPARAEQGETLDVRILGEGFADDAVVSWRRHGTVDPLIVVEQVTFVSETELIASVVVGAEADVSEYDVVVRSERVGVEGIGQRLFEVSSYTPITVASAHPSEGRQGRTLEVRIMGAGFLTDAVPAWERDGAVDTLIVVDQVVFVSDTELRATVTIGLEADLGSYDIAVRSSRKKGIGSEDPRGVGEDIFSVQPYEPEPLGWLVESIWAGTRSMASAINDHGLIAGSAVDASWNWTAVSWNPGAEPVTFGGLHSHATATNNSGWIVGSRGMDLGYHDIPFILENRVLTELGQFHPPFISQPLAINEAGTIVGYGARDDWADPTWPLIWRRNPDGTYGAPEQLPLPDGQHWEIDQHQEGSQAAAIDERGDVVGTLRFGWEPNQLEQAVLWRVRADGTYDEPLILGGMNGRARGVNSAGLIVGSIDLGQRREAVAWHPSDYGTPIRLGRGELWSEAVAVNDAGQVVGHAERSHAVYGGVPIGVLWTLDTGGTTVDQIDLAPPPGYSHSRPRALNAHGWVVGMSEQFQPYRMMATLWRPEER